MKLTVIPLNILSEKEYAFIKDMIATIRRIDLEDIIYDVTVIPFLEENESEIEIVTLNVFLAGKKPSKFVSYMIEEISYLSEKHKVNVEVKILNKYQRFQLQTDIIDPVNAKKETI